MKPAPFDYLRAMSAQDALDALAQYGEDARVLAGGQSLMAVLNMRLAQPKVLVDISRTAELDAVRVDRQAGHLVVNAAATRRKPTSARIARPVLRATRASFGFILEPARYSSSPRKRGSSTPGSLRSTR